MSFIFFLSCVLQYHFFARSMTTGAHRGKRVNLLCAAHLVLLSRVGQYLRRLSGVKRAVQWVGALRFYHGGGASRKGAA